jgi:hypothetical protein
MAARIEHRNSSALADLRALNSVGLGRLLEPLLPACLASFAGDGTLDMVQLIGVELIELEMSQ